MDRYREKNYHIRYSEYLVVLGVSILISMWRHSETKPNESFGIVYITEKVFLFFLDIFYSVLAWKVKAKQTNIVVTIA